VVACFVDQGTPGLSTRRSGSARPAARRGCSSSALRCCPCARPTSLLTGVRGGGGDHPPPECTRAGGENARSVARRTLIPREQQPDRVRTGLPGGQLGSKYNGKLDSRTTKGGIECLLESVADAVPLVMVRERQNLRELAVGSWSLLGDHSMIRFLGVQTFILLTASQAMLRAVPVVVSGAGTKHPG
jgi:hypothetical protein